MKPFFHYQFSVGAVSIAAGSLALACMVTGALAVEYNFAAFSDPVLTLQYAHHYELAKWFNLLDLFGYYLLLLPLVFYLHQQYQFRSPWMPLFTFCGAAYVLTGALGASILTALWPELMRDYLAASAETILTVTALFETTTLLVTQGMWNILEVLLAAFWWIGLGNLLYGENKTLGILTLVAGISTLLDAVGTILNLSTISEVGLNSYLILGIAWPIAMGISLIRKSVAGQSQQTEYPVPEPNLVSPRPGKFTSTPRQPAGFN